ncbi:MAG: efflux RND transporter periplasmic adaptor subunit [Bacillota bacterium]
MKRKASIKIMISILFLIAAIAVNQNIPLSPNQKTDSLSHAESNKEGIPIETTYVQKETLTEKIVYVGTLYPQKTVEVSPKIAGQIIHLSVEEGDFVHAGQVIATLESDSLVAKINTTQAKIDTAAFNLAYLKEEEEKYRILLENGAVSKAVYDKVSHEYGMVEMQLRELYALKNELSVSLEDTMITAPMDGVIRKVNYSTGDLAAAGKPMIVIDDISELVVKVNMSESDLEKVNKKTPVLLQMPGQEEKITASITQFVPVLNNKTRIGEIEIGGIKPDKNAEILIGSSIEAQFVIHEVKESLSIPSQAIKQLTDRQVVYKVENDHVQEISVTTGLRVNNRIQVMEGLQESDRIAVTGLDKLYDGAKVYLFEGNDQQ